MKPLTDRQREVFEYIKRYKTENDVSPTFREIADHFEVSVSAICKILFYIIKKGYLIRDKGKARTIKLCNG